MNLLLTGGTGYIGSAVLRQLTTAGHAVTALVRSEKSAAEVAGPGVTPLVGDLMDTGWATEQLSQVDGAIHTASPGDENSAALDASMAAAAVAAFTGTDKPYVHTGGLWVFGNGSGLSEQSPLRPPALTAWRLAVEDIVLSSPLVASVVVPGVVHGHGGGLPNLLTTAPRTGAGALTLIGDGGQHWSAVHVDDLAELYLIVLGAGRSLGRVLGVTAGAPTVRALAEATGNAVAPEPVEATRARLGADFADALLLDQQFDNGYALGLGWTPSRPSLLEEFRTGAYRA